MAIAYDNSSATTGSGTSVTLSHTCSGSNRLLLVAVGDNALGNITGITYDGVAMTRVFGGGNDDLWYLVNPSSGTHNVVVSQGSASICVAAISYTGCSATQFDASSSNSGTVTVVDPRSWLVGVYNGKKNTGAISGISSNVTDRILTADINAGTHLRLLIADSNGVQTAGSHTISYSSDANLSPDLSTVSIAAEPEVYTLLAGTGAFILTGIDISITKTLYSALGTGAFVLTGIDIGVQQGIGYILNAAVGVFTLIGNNISLLFNGQTAIVRNKAKSATTVRNKPKSY